GAFLLLTPTLHPWYVLWMVPLIALGAEPAWLILAALVPLGYLPLSDWLERGGWHDPVVPRGVEHGAVWLALAVHFALRYRYQKSLKSKDLTLEKAPLISENS